MQEKKLFSLFRLQIANQSLEYFWISSSTFRMLSHTEQFIIVFLVKKQFFQFNFLFRPFGVFWPIFMPLLQRSEWIRRHILFHIKRVAIYTFTHCLCTRCFIPARLCLAWQIALRLQSFPHSHISTIHTFTPAEPTCWRSVCLCDVQDSGIVIMVKNW